MVSEGVGLEMACSFAQRDTRYSRGFNQRDLRLSAVGVVVVVLQMRCQGTCCTPTVDKPYP